MDWENAVILLLILLIVVCCNAPESFLAAMSPGTITQLKAKGAQDLYLTGTPSGYYGYPGWYVPYPGLTGSNASPYNIYGFDPQRQTY